VAGLIGRLEATDTEPHRMRLVRASPLCLSPSLSASFAWQHPMIALYARSLHSNS
jgi:hypothetical protein